MLMLDRDEVYCLFNALNVTKDYYMKLNQPARAAEAQQLYDMLFSIGSNNIYVDINKAIWPDRLQEQLQKREARLQGGKVIDFPYSID